MRTKIIKSDKKIILVNPFDKKIGEIEKIIAHRYGMLHRAFSVLLFRKYKNQLQTLVQQRSKKKYHGGGLWTNTCCSHPRPNETLPKAAKKRLKEEMGIVTNLKEVGKFHYIASLDQGMTENEIDHVFIGTYDEDDIPINRDEVDDYAWMDIPVLQHDLIANKYKYTPWFLQALAIALLAYEITCEKN